MPVWSWLGHGLFDAKILLWLPTTNGSNWVFGLTTQCSKIMSNFPCAAGIINTIERQDRIFSDGRISLQASLVVIWGKTIMATAVVVCGAACSWRGIVHAKPDQGISLLHTRLPDEDDNHDGGNSHNAMLVIIKTLFSAKYFLQIFDKGRDDRTLHFYWTTQNDEAKWYQGWMDLAWCIVPSRAGWRLSLYVMSAEKTKL